MKRTHFYVLSSFTLFALLFTQGNNILNTKNNLNNSNNVSNITNDTNAPTNAEIKDVQSGNESSMMWTVDSSGKDHLYVCGSNFYGLMLNGSRDDDKYSNWIEITDQFDLLSNGGHIKLIDLQFDNAAVVITDSNGTDHLYLWGKNVYGQIGNGETNFFEGTPIEITDQFKSDYPNGVLINEVDINDFATGVITEDPITHENSLYMWGSNREHNIDLNQSYYYAPHKIDLPWQEGETFKDLTLGKGTGIVISNSDPNINDQVYVWGDNPNGGLGITPGTYGTPTKITKNNWTGLDSRNRYDIEMYKGYIYKVNDFKVGYNNSTITLTRSDDLSFIFVFGDQYNKSYYNEHELVNVNWLDYSFYFWGGFTGDSEFLELEGTFSADETLDARSTYGIIVDRDYMNLGTKEKQVYFWGADESMALLPNDKSNYITYPEIVIMDSAFANNTEPIMIALSQKNSIIIFDQTIKTEDNNVGDTRYIANGSNTFGQFGISDYPYDDSNDVGGYVEKENIMPTTSNFEMTTFTQGNVDFNFSIEVSDPYNYLNPNYMKFDALFDEGTNVNQNVTINATFLNSSTIDGVTTWNYEVANLTPGYYHNFNLDFGIYGNDVDTTGFYYLSPALI